MAKVINPANFVLGQNAAMWLNKATIDEIKVLGLQGLGLGLGFSQSSTSVPMMGERISPKVFTGAEYDEMSVNANFIPGDKSQEQLQNAALQATLLKNVRMYLKDGCNFSAPDQISAGGGLISGTSGLNVGNYTDPQIGSPSDIFTNSISFAPAGPFALFVAHTVNGLGAEITVARTTDTTLTTTGTEWADLGFEVEDTILVDWDGDSPESPKYGRCKAISGAVLTLAAGEGDADSIVVGAMAAAFQVHGATAMAATNLSTTC